MDHLKHVLLTVDCMMVHMVWWVFILKIKYQTYNLKNVMLCSILFECVIKGEVSVRGKQKINKTELLFDHKCSKIFTYTLLRFLFLFRLEMGSCVETYRFLPTISGTPYFYNGACTFQTVCW